MNRMPWRPQWSPERIDATAVIGTAVPPDTAIRLMAPSDQNAIDSPSGENTGLTIAVGPGSVIGRASRSSIDFTYSRLAARYAI